MTLAADAMLAWTWSQFIWNMGAGFLFLLGLILILVVLVQESSGGGIGGAFGGGGGDSVLGARGQRGVSRFTAMLGIIFAVLLMTLGKCDPNQQLRLPGDPEAGEALRAPEEPEKVNDSGEGAKEDDVRRILEGGAGEEYDR